MAYDGETDDNDTTDNSDDRTVVDRREIGGVYVEVYDDGDVAIDQREIRRDIDDAIDNTVSQWKFSCLMSIGLVVIVVGVLGGAAAYIYMTVTGSAPDLMSFDIRPTKTSSWDGKAPLVCEANDKLRIENVTAKLSGTAITARGNCILTIKGATISADTAIVTSSNARVHVSGGRLEGSGNAISASGNSKVEIEGVELHGAVDKSGFAKVSVKP